MVVAACSRSKGRYTASVIRDLAERDLWQLWIAVDSEGSICAVAGTELVTYPTGLLALVIHFGTGRRREIWQHFMEDVVAWGKSRGCVLAEGAMRRGWRRVLPGWSHTHDFVDRAI